MSGRAPRRAIAYILLIFIHIYSYAGAIGLGRLSTSGDTGDHVELWMDVIVPEGGPVAGFHARLADPAAFEREGIPYDPALHAYRITVESHDGIPQRIHVRGPRPQGSPLPMLIEVRWDNGRLLREIEVPAAAPPRQLPSGRAAETRPPPAPLAPQTRRPEARPHTQRDTGGNTALAAPPAEPPGVTPKPGEHYVVRPGDTLYRIARRMGAGDPRSVARRIFLANPDAFAGGDMDRLLAGTVLDLGRLPPASNQAAASGVPASPPTPAGAESRESATTPPADETVDVEPPEPFGPELGPEVDEGPEEVDHAQARPREPTGETLEAPAPAELHILAPDEHTASGTGAAPSPSREEALAQALGLARELAESRRREAEGLRDRLRQLERLVERQENLIALQTEQLAALQARLDRVLERQSPAPTPPPSPWVMWAALAVSTVTLMLALTLALAVRRRRGSRR